MDHTTQVLFVSGVLLILLTPGPTNTLLATSGAIVGLRRSLPLLLAEVGGYLSTVITVGFLFKPWVLAVPSANQALRLGAAAWLLFIAFKTFRTSPESPKKTVSFRHVFITTLLNPKGLIFSLVLIPTERPDGPLYVVAFAAMVVTVGSAWIWIGHTVGRVTGVGSSIIQKIASVTLSCFGALLIVSVFLR